MVSVGDVGVDDGCKAEAGDDDAEAGDCLGEADGGWHGGLGGCWCLYPAQAGQWAHNCSAGSLRMLAGLLHLPQPHTQYCAILCDLTITISHHLQQSHTISHHSPSSHIISHHLTPSQIMTLDIFII